MRGAARRSSRAPPRLASRRGHRLRKTPPRPLRGSGGATHLAGGLQAEDKVLVLVPELDILKQREQLLGDVDAGLRAGDGGKSEKRGKGERV